MKEASKERNNARCEGRLLEIEILPEERKMQEGFVVRLKPFVRDGGFTPQPHQPWCIWSRPK
jgi:hypothetical protein